MVEIYDHALKGVAIAPTFLPAVKNNKRLLMVIPWAAFVYTGRNSLR